MKTSERMKAAGEEKEATIAARESDGAPPRYVIEEDVRDLVNRIVPRDDDEAAKALIALIHAIAYEADFCRRDSMATYACNAAYERTWAFGDVAVKFFDAATAEFPLRSS